MLARASVISPQQSVLWWTSTEAALFYSKYDISYICGPGAQNQS